MCSDAPVVFVKNNDVFANSRDVAMFCGKRHDNVLADIRKLLSDITPEERVKWFQKTTVEQRTGFGVRRVPAYDMTRDGFAILVMGYTGPKAIEFKVRYIQEFTRMERELRNNMPVSSSVIGSAEAARAWADEYEQAKEETKMALSAMPSLGPCGGGVS